MPLNKSFLGKVYTSADPWPVEAAATRAYAAATNTTNPRYLEDGALMAPPMYGVVFTYLALAQPLFDTELGVNMMRLVHGEQDMRFFKAVKPGDVIKTSSTIKAISDKTSGELLDVALEAVNQHGEKVMEAVSGLFIKGRVRGAKKEDVERQEEVPPSGKVVLETQVTVAPDQSIRYADASGDHNPIHEDPNMARAAGLPDIILHGLCSMAFVHNALTEKMCGGDPLKVSRLRVRFNKPVMMGDVLTIKVFETTTPRHFAVEVYNPAGQAVIKDGLAELT
jgi:acyl dehydratase